MCVIGKTVQSHAELMSWKMGSRLKVSSLDMCHSGSLKVERFVRF